MPHPQILRGLAGYLPARRARSHRRLLFTEVSRDIYWGAETPPADLKAQVTIALIQFGLLPKEDGEHLDWLVSYLRTFKMRLPSHVEEATSLRNVVACETRNRLIDKWFFPEDFRAFRKYVSKTIRGFLRNCVSSQGASDLVCEYIEGIESNGTKNGGRSQQQVRSLRTVAPQQVEPDKLLSAADAASSLDVSKSYLLRLARLGNIESILKDGRVQFRGSEILRISKILKDRVGIRECVRQLAEEGRTPEAARKAAYRRYGKRPTVVNTENS